MLNPMTNPMLATDTTRRARPVVGRHLTVVLACAALSACSAEAGFDSPQSAAEEGAAASGTDEIQHLDELTFGDQTLTFDWLPSLDENGEAGVAGNVLLDYTFGQHDVLGALTREHGLLTSLETFRAFAPKGSEPDPKLVESHPREALALGRADLTPKQVDAASVLLEKAISSNCNSNVLQGISPLHYENQKIIDIQLDGVSFYLCAGGTNGQGSSLNKCPGIPSTKLVVVGLCNDQLSSEATSYFFSLNNPTVTFPKTLLPGASDRFQVLPQTGTVTSTRKLAVDSRNGSVFTQNAHRQLSGVGAP